jgi:4-aminobutyrate aminotransferase
MDKSLPLKAEHLAPVWTRYFDLIGDRGQDRYVWDIEGPPCVDFTLGICVTSIGRYRPEVVTSARELPALGKAAVPIAQAHR